MKLRLMRPKRDFAQIPLLPKEPSLRPPPSTRYQGSKFKLLDWIWENLRSLDFDTVLDAFGGTGCVSYLLKVHGKSVTYNDYLRSNHLIGTALIENNDTTLSPNDVSNILRRDLTARYDDLIATTFDAIYFTAEENAWLDVACQIGRAHV